MNQTKPMKTEELLTSDKDLREQVRCLRACEWQSERAALLELLCLALPYVVEGEAFNKPNLSRLSEAMRKVISAADNK